MQTHDQVRQRAYYRPGAWTGPDPTFRVSIEGVIEPSNVSAQEILADLAARPTTQRIEVSINSIGGDIYEALGLFVGLKQHPARVVAVIQGEASSAASIIAMAADHISIAEDASMTIHNPMARADMYGAAELRRLANKIDSVSGTIREIYATRARVDDRRLAGMMAANTRLSAQEALAYGFVDHVFPVPVSSEATRLGPRMQRRFGRPAA